MQVEATTSSAGPATFSEPALDLDSEAFLTLLVAQLRHQDPLNPVNNEQLVVQLAQLSEVETIRSMGSAMDEVKTAVSGLADATRVGAAAGMIGLQVAYRSGDTLQVGLVSGLAIEGNQIKAVVGDRHVPLADIVEVKTKSAQTQ